jgi:hypothetical protein
MAYYILKVSVSAVLIVLISELAKKSTFAGSVLASIPFISVLAMVWLYIETRDISRVSDLSYGIFWLVIPSLALFASLPLLLKMNLNFYVAMGIAVALTVLCYIAAIGLVNQFIFTK